MIYNIYFIFANAKTLIIIIVQVTSVVNVLVITSYSIHYTKLYDDKLMDRVDALCDAKVDIIALDTSHGHSEFVLKSVAMIKEKYPDVV